MNVDAIFVGVPKPFMTGSHNCKLMTSLASLEKYPMHSYQDDVLSVQI